MKTVAFIFFLLTCLTSASKAQQKKMDLAERWRDKPRTIIISSFDSAYYWNQKTYGVRVEPFTPNWIP